MNPKLKLKVAAEEIKEILRKHDIAATVALHTPGHGEYFFHFHTSYSVAYIIEDGEVRFHSKAKDFKSPQEQDEKNAATSNMMRILADITALNFKNVHSFSEHLDKLLGAEHTLINHTQH